MYARENFSIFRFGPSFLGIGGSNSMVGLILKIPIKNISSQAYIQHRAIAFKILKAILYRIEIF